MGNTIFVFAFLFLKMGRKMYRKPCKSGVFGCKLCKVLPSQDAHRSNAFCTFRGAGRCDRIDFIYHTGSVAARVRKPLATEEEERLRGLVWYKNLGKILGIFYEASEFWGCYPFLLCHFEVILCNFASPFLPLGLDEFMKVGF